MSGVPQAGRPQGGLQPSHCQNIFTKNQKKKKKNWKLKNKKIKETYYTLIRPLFYYGVHTMISITVPSPHKLEGRIKNNSGVQGHSFKA